MNFSPDFFAKYPDIFDDNFIKNFHIEPFGAGLINFSWVISRLDGSQKYFLQQLNTVVFSNVEALENNLIESQKFLQNLDFRLIFPYKNTDGKMHTVFDGNTFRIYPFISGGDTHQKAPSIDHIFSAAKKFGEFSRILTPIASSLQETIPNFHNLSARYHEYKKILQENAYSDRKNFAKDEIFEIEKMSWIVKKFDEYKQKIPKRVYHHDAKINNILFEKKSHHAMFPVDLDTIMSGYIFSDFGDMVWSMVFGIDHNKPEKTYFDEEKYNALVSGYISGFGEEISGEEISAMHFGGIVMSYMLAIRFLSDFLNGDKYFKTQYELQNFDRAKYQIDIVKQLIDMVSSKI